MRASQEVSYEVIFLDNTPNRQHRSMAEHAFQNIASQCVRTLYISHTVPGKAEAQNMGIRAASGDYCVFLDDDVLPEPDLLIAYDRAFAEFDCGAVQGRVQLQFAEGCRLPIWLSDRRFRLALAEMDFGEVIYPFEMGLTGANMAFRAEMFERHGFFDERFGPGRTGTLEDQEFSERIRERGERQLFWPHASVRHLIPTERLRIGSFARIGYDVGYSDYLLSHKLVKHGRCRFTLYSAKEAVKTIGQVVSSAILLRKGDAVYAYCDLFRLYGYWKQGMSR